MAVHPCPRCRRMIPVGQQYCEACRPVVEQQLEQYRAENKRKKNKKYNQARREKYAAFYRSKEWRTLSASFMQAAGYRCQAHASDRCNGLAMEVHHVQPIQTPEGWERRLDWSNLEAVCTACHNVRHPERSRYSTPPGVIDLRKIKT